MFKSTPAFSSYSVNDIEAAKKFYSDILGFEIEQPMGQLSFNLANGHEVFIYGKPDHEPATYTVLNFKVDDIEKVVDDLIARGVKFEQYNNEYIKTDEKGISRGSEEPAAMAWFKDTAGNIISVLQEAN